MSAVRVPNFHYSPTHLSPEIQGVFENFFFISALFSKVLEKPVGVCWKVSVLVPSVSAVQSE